MEKVKIYLEYKKYKLDITLDNKITIILGLSGTGKSSIHNILTKINSSRKQGKIEISNKRLKFLYVNNEQLIMYGIHDEHLPEDTIYIIDEGRVHIDNYLATIIKNTINSYFIFTTRDVIHTLNYDMYSVKELVHLKNGISTFKNYINTHIQNEEEISKSSLNNIIIEDSGKAQQWFTKLFENMSIRIESVHGKDNICYRLEQELKNNNSNILVIMDRCSFGCQTYKFKGLIDKYGSHVFMISNYKSWEYLMLNTNMYKNYYKPYEVDIPLFEEEYYEQELERISGDNQECSRYTKIKHETKINVQSKLKKCYTDKCCAYSNRISECKYGLHGEDKINALLSGTLFHGLLVLTRRI